MPKLDLKIPGSTVVERNPLFEGAFGGASGFVLGSAANAAGGAAGKIVTALTGIPLKVTALVGSVGAGAYLVHFLGNLPLSPVLKICVSTTSIFWPTVFGSGLPGPGISENRRNNWKAIALLCGFSVAAGGAHLGNHALGTFIGGIVGNLIAKVGRTPEAQLPHEA